MLVYAFTGTSMLPAIFVMLAVYDGSHSIQVRESDRGTHLLLHHDAGNYTPAVCDHENRVAKFMVTLCRPDHEGDHCLLSAHMRVSITSEDHSLKGLAKSNQMLNYGATEKLVFSFPRYSDNEAQARMNDLGQACLKHRQENWGTVQMLV